MAIFQSDAVFKRVVEVILEDTRANHWLLDDILSDFPQDPLLARFGQNEINKCREWFLNNEVKVYLSNRIDTETMPCVTIHVNSSTEDRSLARMGDVTPYSQDYTSSEIGQSVKYIISPFDIVSYNQVLGYFEVPSTVNIALIYPGMVVIDPQTGTGYAIDKKDAKGFFIAAGTVFTATRVGILPHYMTFRARREMATFQETITIGCHAHGDPSTLLWLHSIILYGLLRYREGLMESRNFQISTIQSSSEMVRNDSFSSFGENVYSRFINLNGQTEHSWVKTPKRYIEGLLIKNNTGNIIDQTNGADTQVDGSGIIIFKEDGKEVPPVVDQSTEVWLGKDSEPEE